ncbi:DUF3859 domain-containing protein [Roseivivax sp. CAU 1761]
MLLLLAATGRAAAGSAEFDPLRFDLQQGIFCEVRTDGRAPAPDTVAGEIELFSEIPDFQWLGARVPAVPGISFGVRTEARDARIYSGVTMRLTHPAFRRSGATEQSYVTSLGGAGVSINAYTFDTAEELALGIWTFTARHGDEVLYHAQFEVVPPAAEPRIAAACGGMPLS